MEQRLSWETKRTLASQEISSILCNKKVHYRIHNLSLSLARSIQSVTPFHFQKDPF
jgi:hypothetical protein